MPDFIVILGREPELSVAEVVALARREHLNLAWQTITPHYALFEADCSADQLQVLAGVVKCAQVLQTIPNDPDKLAELARETLTAAGYEQWHFGFSWYGVPPRWLKTVGMAIKREGKEAGKRARLVVAKESTLSSVVVAKNKLLPPEGCEFIVLPQGKAELLVARTLWVQAFEEWSERDYGRPERDAKVGMLPPKLARLMVNLAQTPRGQALLDPFCGSGTVLQEAALLGYGDLWGADASAAGIERSKTNLAWLKDKNPSLTADFNLQVADIKDLAAKLEEQRFGAIVTEPYLGPPLGGHEGEERLRVIQQQLVELYTIATSTLARLLEPTGRLVMVWPAFQGQSKLIELPLTIARTAGLVAERLLPTGVPAVWVRERGSLLYGRPGQRVVREIFVFRRA